MTTFNDSVSLQGLYQHTKFLSGQDNLSIEDFTRMANFAVDDYSSIVLTCDGRWKFADSTSTTIPMGYTQVTAGQRAYTLDSLFLFIDKVEFRDSNGNWAPLEAIDQRDYKNESLEQRFTETGTPRYYDYDGVQIKLYPAPDFSDSGDAETIANNSLLVSHTSPASHFDTTDTTAPIGIPRVHHEYIPLKVAQKVMIGGNDQSKSDIAQELIKWEGREVNGQMTGGKIREFYTKRDENTPRRLKPAGTNRAFINQFKRV